MVTLGSDDHKESQVPELWLESNYFSPTNFCFTCEDQSHTRSSCEKKGDATFCGFCGRQDHRTTHCPVKSSARTIFAALTLKRLISTGYNEFTDFNPVLSDVVSHTWQIPLGDLAPSAPEVSVSPSPPPPVEIPRDAESMDVEVDPPQDISLPLSLTSASKLPILRASGSNSSRISPELSATKSCPFLGRLCTS